MNETLRILSDKIEEERKVIIEDLGMGRAKDYAQYQNAAGKVLGFMSVQGLIVDMLRNLREEDGNE
jgi:hypothetical protein